MTARTIVFHSFTSKTLAIKIFCTYRDYKHTIAQVGRCSQMLFLNKINFFAIKNPNSQAVFCRNRFANLLQLCKVAFWHSSSPREVVVNRLLNSERDIFKDTDRLDDCFVLQFFHNKNSLEVCR